MSFQPSGDIEVIEVTPEQMAALGGRPWADVRAEAERDATMLIRTAQYWHGGQLQGVDGTCRLPAPRWTPPVDRQGRELAYVPTGRAWLRNVDGRAFLYLQNW
jgi:hypothetical protein